MSSWQGIPTMPLGYLYLHDVDHREAFFSRLCRSILSICILFMYLLQVLGTQKRTINRRKRRKKKTWEKRNSYADAMPGPIKLAADVVKTQQLLLERTNRNCPVS